MCNGSIPQTNYPSGHVGLGSIDRVTENPTQYPKDIHLIPRRRRRGGIDVRIHPSGLRSFFVGWFDRYQLIFGILTPRQTSWTNPEGDQKYCDKSPGHGHHLGGFFRVPLSHSVEKASSFWSFGIHYVHSSGLVVFCFFFLSCGFVSCRGAVFLKGPRSVVSITAIPRKPRSTFTASS